MARLAVVAGSLLVAAGQEGCVGPLPLSEDWLLMSDATGHTTYDLGKYDECVDWPAAQYCIMTTSVFTFGVCIPRACAVANITNPDLGVMGFIIDTIPGLIFLDPYDSTFTCGTHAHAWTAPATGIVTALSLLGAVVLASTVLDGYDRYLHSRAKRQRKAELELRSGMDWTGGQSPQPHASQYNDMETAYASDDEDDNDEAFLLKSRSYAAGTRPMAIPTPASAPLSINGSSTGAGSLNGGLSMSLRAQASTSLGIMTGMGAAMPLVGSLPSAAAGQLAASYVPPTLTLRARSFRPGISSPLGMELTQTAAAPASPATAPSRTMGNGNGYSGAVARRALASQGYDAGSPVLARSSTPVVPALRGTGGASYSDARPGRERRHSSTGDGDARALAYAKYDIFAGSTVRSLLKAFSLRHNVPRLLSVKGDRSGVLASFNGMRSLSMALIILGHTLTYMIAVGYVNSDDLFPPTGAITTWSYQVFPSSEFAVDTFLVLGGFLAAHALLKHVLNDGTVFFTWTDVAFFLLHRLMRILPVYALVLAMNMYLLPLLSEGPFWFMVDEELSNCKTAWWSNLLLINDVFPWMNNTSSQCMGWTFYLAIDIKLYALTPLFVALYLVVAPAAVTALSILIIASISVAGYVVAINNLSVIPSANLQTQIDYSDMYYTKPWMRCPPYFLGILLAFLWDRVQRSRRQVEAAIALPQNVIGIETFVAMHSQSRYVDPYKWSRVQQGAVQLIAAGMMAAVMYGGLGAYQDPASWTRTTHVAYTILSRPSWALGVCVILFVCITHPRNGLNRIMGAPLWEPLSRLTFGAYLVHPIVMQIFYFSSTTYFRFSVLNVAAWFVTNLVFSYAIAALLFVVVEKPLSNVEVVLVRAYEEWRTARTAAAEAAGSSLDTSMDASTSKSAAQRPTVIVRDDRVPMLASTSTI